MPQHLNSLAYYGEYLRNILHSVFVEHKFEIPMWDMHIGYGSDILTTLHYYVIGDPLTLLSVFVSPEKSRISVCVSDLFENLSCGNCIQQILFLSQKFKAGSPSGLSDLYICGMDDLCGYETSVFCQSNDLSSSDPFGN